MGAQCVVKLESSNMAGILLPFEKLTKYFPNDNPAEHRFINHFCINRFREVGRPCPKQQGRAKRFTSQAGINSL